MGDKGMKVSGGIPGSREPSPSFTGLGPPGFDPGRVVAAWHRYGDIPPEDFARHYVAEAIARACSLVAYPDASDYVLDRLVETFAVKCIPEAEAAIAAVREIDAGWLAIAMEARQGGDGETRLHAKHESAVPKDIAHPIPCDPTTPKQEGPNV